MGRELSEKNILPEIASTIKTALDQYSSNAAAREETLSKLLHHPTAARSLVMEQQRELQRQTVALQELEKDLHRRAVTRDLLAELAKPEEQIDLLRASLLLARHDDVEVELEQYMQQFQFMVDELADDPEISQGTVAAVKHLNRYLFEQGGFHGSRHDYESKSNSYMSALLDDREGLPITLSVLYLELAARLKIANVYGVPLPGRFMVGYKDGPEGELKLLDVFNQGKQLTVEQAALDLTENGTFDAEFLEPTTKRSIILRMLRNLMSGLLDQQSKVKETLPYLNLVVAIDPESMIERLTRAQMNQRIGEKASALADVQWLMEHFPESGPENMRAMLDEWSQSLRTP